MAGALNHQLEAESNVRVREVNDNLLLMIPHCPFLVGLFYKFLTATVKKCKRHFKNNCSGCGGGGKNRLCRLSAGALNRKESPFVHATI